MTQHVAGSSRKIAGFSRVGTIEVLAVYAILGVERSVGTMEEDSELAIAMIVVVFAAVLLVTAQLFIESFDALAVSSMTLRGEKGVFDAVASLLVLAFPGHNRLPGTKEFISR